MLTNSKIALWVALVLASASAAAAASRQAIRHQNATEQQLGAGPYLGAGSARSSDSVNLPCYFKIQNIGIREGNGFTPTSFGCNRLNRGRS